MYQLNTPDMYVDDVCAMIEKTKYIAYAQDCAGYEMEDYINERVGLDIGVLLTLVKEQHISLGGKSLCKSRCI